MLNRQARPRTRRRVQRPAADDGFPGLLGLPGVVTRGDGDEAGGVLKYEVTKSSY